MVFDAATPSEEMSSTSKSTIMSTENVTGRVQAALQGAHTPEKEFSERRAWITLFSARAKKSTGLRSDVVTLYQGGEYWLYRYRKYTDVRLVRA